MDIYVSWDVMPCSLTERSALARSILPPHALKIVAALSSKVSKYVTNTTPQPKTL